MNPTTHRRAPRATISLSAILMLALAGCASEPPPPPAVVSAPVHDASKAPRAPAPGALLDGVAAVVNDDVILKSELDVQVAQAEKQILAHNTPLPAQDVLQKQVLDQMVVTRIELQQAASRGITVSDDSVNQALSRIAARAGVTLDKLPDELSKQGLQYDQFRKDLRDQIVIQNLEQQVLSDQLRITQQDIDDQLRLDQGSGDSETQYHVAQILVATPFNPTADDVAAARKKIDVVYQKLKSGTDFAAAAVAYSEGQKALDGGDIGWRKASELPTLFAPLVKQMKPGDFSEPVQSASGFHIVKLIDMKSSEQKVMVTQTHARHILVRTSAILNEEQAKAKIEALYQQLKAGADFAKLAAANSDDPGSGKQGGDLGWLDPGATVPPFQAAMDKLQPGELSPPFQSQFGWHVVQVLGRREADQTDASRRNRAYEAIFARKSEEVIQQWLSEIKDTAFIEYHLGQ
ncbi:MAG TPA: peptidylprolyl isomerase [Gammaproteobacteria bacterium]|jgi:peptidyl-prolyl cis-trans isomerase SurA|nr:peptidylprolyl isomerase [Gammaproteobacteria bacterium]